MCLREVLGVMVILHIPTGVWVTWMYAFVEIPSKIDLRFVHIIVCKIIGWGAAGRPENKYRTLANDMQADVGVKE